MDYSGILHGLIIEWGSRSLDYGSHALLRGQGDLASWFLN